MKTIWKRLLAAFMLASMFAQTTALAAPTADDPEGDHLVSTVRIEQEDGSYTVEKTYTNHSPQYYSDHTYGTDRIRKVSEKYTAQDTLVIQYEVVATFDWSRHTEITRVYSPSGKILYHQNGNLSHESILTEGSETCKSNVVYRFLHTTDSGDLEDYLVTLSCDYHGRT